MHTLAQTTSRARAIKVPSQFAWLKYLNANEQAEFISGLLKHILTAVKRDDWTPVTEWIEEWKATANIYADAKVTRGVQQGRAELARGEVVDWDALRQELGL